MGKHREVHVRNCDPADGRCLMFSTGKQREVHMRNGTALLTGAPTITTARVRGHDVEKHDERDPT